METKKTVIRIQLSANGIYNKDRKVKSHVIHLEDLPGTADEYNNISIETVYSLLGIVSSKLGSVVSKFKKDSIKNMALNMRLVSITDNGNYKTESYEVFNIKRYALGIFPNGVITLLPT